MPPALLDYEIHHLFLLLWREFGIGFEPKTNGSEKQKGGEEKKEEHKRYLKSRKAFGGTKKIRKANTK